MKNQTKKITLTPQQIQQLNPYKQLLLKAAKKQYITQIDKKNSIPQLKKIYHEITGTQPPQTSCTSCSGSTTWLTRLSLWYNEHTNQTQTNPK